MSRQYRLPGHGFLNETRTGQYRLAGGAFVNETDAATASSDGTASGTSTVSGAGVTGAVGSGAAAGTSTASGVPQGNSASGAASGTSSASGAAGSTASSGGTASGSSTAQGEPLVPAAHSDNTSYRLPGHGTINETTVRQYRLPGGPFLNETQVTGYAGTASGTSTVTGVGVAVSSGTALSTGTSSAAGYAATLASASGTAAGTSSATGDGTAFVTNTVVCVCPGDYFSYICLDRRADRSVTSGTAAGSATVTGDSGYAVSASGTASGTSTAVGSTTVTASPSSGTAAGSSTVTGVGTTDAPVELAILGTPLVVYSDIRPAGYSGNTFRVARESDNAQLDIGFLANGRADYPAADAFAPLGWRRHTQYDLSGNGYHLTVPATVQAPKDFGNTIEGFRTLTFNGPGTTQALANLSVPWSDVRNVAIMAIIKTANQGVFEVGNPTRKMSLLGSLDSGINWSGIQGQYAVTSPQVLVARGNGAASRVLTQNHRVTTAAAQASSPATGFTLGNAVGYANPGNVDVLCLVGYDTAVYDPDSAALADTAYAAVPAIPRACHDVIAAHGDSILAGNSRTANLSYEALWYSKLIGATARPFTWYNCGHGGYTVTQLLAVAAAVAAACYDPLGTNTVILSGGSNDLAKNETAADTYARIVQWANIWYAAGFTHVHVNDVIPRKAIFSGGATAASFEAQRQLLIGMIAAGVGVDFDSASSPGTHPVLGDPANCTSVNFLDLVHPNVVGNGYYFDAVEPTTTSFRT